MTMDQRAFVFATRLEGTAYKVNNAGKYVFEFKTI